MNLLLLKTNELNDTQDRYLKYFNELSTRHIQSIKIINLLEFNFINRNDLNKKLDDCFSSASQITSLIITSKQAIKAISYLDSINFDHEKRDKLIVYSVGNQTTKLFNELIISKFSYLSNSYLIKCIGQMIGRKQCATELAKYILEDSVSFKNKPFHAFYPCSSIRGDSFTNVLREHSLIIDELFVYETISSQNGVQHLNDYLDIIDPLSLHCFVFFSPSIVEIAFEKCLKRLDLKILNNFHLISIGPSTSKKIEFFIKELNLNTILIETCEPSPEALDKALESIRMK